MRRGVLSGLAGALALLAVSPASAGPLGGVLVDGDCPSAALVDAAVERRHLPPEATAYRLTVHGGAGSAEVSLADQSGQLVATRRLDSDDCSAMAEAAALIAETYFVELLGRATATQSAGAETAGSVPSAPPGAAAPRGTEAPGTEPPPAEPPNAARPPHEQQPHPPATTAPRPMPSPQAPHPAPRLAFEAALEGGLGWLPEATAWTGVGQGVLGLFLPRSALDLELDPALETSATLDIGNDRVLRTERRLGLRVDRRFGTDSSLAPWLGIGAAAARLRLVTLPGGPTRTRVTPTVEAGVTARFPITRAWSLRGELACRLLEIRENYRVTGEGSIGSGPRLGCALLAGFGWVSPAP